MADNSPQGGSDTIATDEVSTLNGGASSGVKVARAKVTFGDDGDSRDASAAFPLPTATPVLIASGSLTAAAQVVTLADIRDASAVTAQVSGTWVGTLQFEATNDDTTWWPVNAVRSGTSAISSTGTVNAMYRLTPGGVKGVRVRASAWTSGTAVVTMRASSGVGGMFANQILPVDDDAHRIMSFVGRGSTFRTPGRAGTAGQKLFSIYNAAGSTVLVDVEKLTIDFVCTVVKAVTVLPPVVRLYRVTVQPTNGTAVTKATRDTAQSSSASVSVLQDASADGTGSGTTLTATLPAGNVIGAEYAPRLITAVGYEPADRIEFVEEVDERITLRAGEGLVVMLEYTLATQNPVTDMWMVTGKWTEYTAA